MAFAIVEEMEPVVLSAPEAVELREVEEDIWSTTRVQSPEIPIEYMQLTFVPATSPRSPTSRLALIVFKI